MHGTNMKKKNSSSCDVIKIENVLAENFTEILDARFSGEEKTILRLNFKFNLGYE